MGFTETIICILVKLENGEEIYLPKKDYEINPIPGSYVIQEHRKKWALSKTS